MNTPPLKEIMTTPSIARGKLKYLMNAQQNIPPQGTDEWLEFRQHQFGGSEIAAVIGKSPYTKPSDVIENKTNYVKFDAAPCAFGRMFEPVAKRFMKDDLGIEIHELTSIKSSKYPVAYSPDGIILDEDNDKLILLEIKCPFRRYKIQDVPKYYLHQVQTGMGILPVDSCAFYQFRFRLCNMWDLGKTPKYNRWLHREPRKRVPDEDPLFYGYIHFSEEGRWIDYGRLTPDTADELVDLPRVKPRMIHINEIPSRPYLGQMVPFKCFAYHKTDLAPEDDYLETIAPVLWQRFLQLQ